MKEHYCPHCHLVYKSETCPSCGLKGKLSSPEDLIFYLEGNYFEAPRIEDFLRERGIPYLKKGELGAGLTSRIGLSFEHEHFFIPLKAFRDYQEELEAFREVIDGSK